MHSLAIGTNKMRFIDNDQIEPIELTGTLIDRLDIGVAMNKLCPTARAICEQLSEGQSINEIANRMGVSWHTVNKHLATIRECFASVGLSELAT